MLRKFTPQLEACIEQSDVWYTGENTKLNASVIHTIKHRKARIVWMLQTTLWELIIATKEWLWWCEMAYCVLDLYNIPVLREDKKRLRLHPLVQDSWIFQGHLPDGRSFRPLFFHSIKCSKMNGRTLTNCSQEGNRYQIQRTVLPFCLTYLSEISHVTE